MKDNLIGFVQEKLLILMDYFHGLCETEGINYSLAYGTMLGAVRHEGFIPWDDDADVFMTRTEYEKFREAAARCPHEDIAFEEYRYWIKKLTLKNTPEYGGKKLSGKIQLDIFILDELPSLEKERKRLLFSLRKYQGMLSVERIFERRRTFKEKLLLLGTRIMGKLRTRKSLCVSYDKISKKYAGTNASQYFNSNSSFHGLSTIFQKKWLQKTENRPFEGRLYKIFSAYDEMLTAAYGDYMTPPPPEKRVMPHIRLL